jgi:perosamine synthetase
MGEEEKAALEEVLQSGNLVQGEKVREFEDQFASYIGVKHAIAVANGTVALDLALKAIDVKVDNEAITPAFSFVASSNCILYQGAKPVFADINRKTFNIDPSDVEKKITTKTKAIIAVHLYGQPAELETLKKIAEEHEVALVEDAAQAHGAEYKGSRAGSLGDIGCFSFYATKNMTTGEGGMLTTNSDELVRKARLLRDHGQSRKYHHSILGYNYRMTEITAAIGLAQLKKLDEFNRKRQSNATMLTEGIKKIAGLTPPYVKSHLTHVFHQYVIKVEESYPMTRNDLAEHLKKHGIEVAVHYPIPIYKQPAYKALGYGQIHCLVTEEACGKVLSLPVHPSVTKEACKRIIDVLTPSQKTFSS